MKRKLQQLLKTGMLSLLLSCCNLYSWAQLSFDWAHQVGSSSMISTSSKREAIYGTAVDHEGNVFVTGNFTDTVDFDPGPGMAELFITGLPGRPEAFLAKYDATGNYLWVIKLADSIAYGHNSVGMGAPLTVDAIGNVYVTGNLFGTGDFDPGPNVNQFQYGSSQGASFIGKYNGEGHYIWAKGFGDFSGIFGDVGQLHGVGFDTSGHIYFSGVFSGTVDFDPGPGTAELTSTLYDPFGDGTLMSANDIFMACYDTAGNYQWVKQLGAPAAKTNWSTAFDTAGNFCMVGFFVGTMDFDPGPGEINLTSTLVNRPTIFIAKYDREGNYLSATKLSGTGLANNSRNYIVADQQGGLYLTGRFSDTMDFDPGPGEAIVSTGGLYNHRYFLAKYDAGLNYEWSVMLESDIGMISIRNPSLDERSGNVYITGSFSGMVDFDPEPDAAELTTTGGNDAFLAAYDACGNFLYAGQMGGATQNNAISIIDLTIKNDQLCASGYFEDTVNISPLADTVSLIPAGLNDGFILQLHIGRDTLTETACDSFVFNTTAYSTSGIYLTTMPSSLGCDSMVTLNLTIIPNPELTLDNETLTASEADTYQWWSCDDNAVIAGASEQTYTPIITGSYAVITTTNGCTDTSECILVDVTGVDELYPGNRVLLYPNPTKGLLQIQAEQAFQQVTIRLVNILGQTLSVQGPISGKTYNLDMAAHAPGLYFIEMSKGDKILLRKKVVKQ